MKQAEEMPFITSVYVVGGKTSSELVIKTICSHLKENASQWWSENNIQHLKSVWKNYNGIVSFLLKYQTTFIQIV